MDFKQEYVLEVKDILKKLEQSLMRLEKSPNNPDEINNVYRYLHTLKGSAGMFDYLLVEKLSHELEFLYSDIRDGIRDQDDYILDLTLHAVDVFKDLIDGDNSDEEVDKIIKDIRILCDKPETDNGVDEAGVTGSGTLQPYAIFFRPEENIFKRGINLQAILDDVEELGQVEIFVHNETQPLEIQLKEKRIESWFEILLATNRSIDDIKEIFLFLKETEFTIIPVEHAASFNTEVYNQVITLNDEQISQRLIKLEEWIPGFFGQKDVEMSISPASDESPIEAISDEPPDNSDGDAQDITIEWKSRDKNAHVSVSTEKLDYLINIVSELVTFRSELQHLMRDQKNNKITESIEKLDRLTLRLRDSAFNIRLVPLNIIKVKLQRLIRTVSKELGKEVEFITDGLDTELDRSMINALEAPLMHIIRNAIDHGIESPEERMGKNKARAGLLKLSSYNSGDHVFIQVQDDGKGIDFKKIQKKGVELGLLAKNQTYSEKELLTTMMSPGFSTAEKVTTVSGRGVGMDVVKKEIAALRGEIEISTEEGLGSIFSIRLPLTLTILDTLVVNIEESKYLIPINEIEYCYEEEHKKLFSKKSRQIQYKGQLTPFISLREYFGKAGFPKKETVVVINKNDTQVAVVVDGIVGQLQTVYKPLNELLQPINCFSGASILGDGSTALILNALKLNN